jgi:transcription initiation factor TFIIA large subunit
MAQQRAQALVAQRMGQNPPSHMPMHHQQQNQQFYNQGQQRMMQGQPQQRPPQQQMQQRPPPGHVYTSQTDGSDGSDGALEDWNALKAARAAAFAQDPEGHIAADQLMRTQIEAMMAEQDVGLGMPLSQIPKGKKRKAITRVRQAKQAEQAASSSSSVPPVARFDGEDGESPKENPEDAINSDLDDPEDDVDGADGSDDEMVDYMVCTYDKVQRVKNKWKCTLKDGILTSNKKEYVSFSPI